MGGAGCVSQSLVGQRNFLKVLHKNKRVLGLVLRSTNITFSDKFVTGGLQILIAEFHSDRVELVCEKLGRFCLVVTI